MDGMPEALHSLNHSNLPIQLILVAGGDEDLHTRFEMTRWHVPGKIFNYVDFMPRLMHASDAIICKAGGLIVSEAMACGLPMLLTNVLPGQETGNAEYVVGCGGGDMVSDSEQMLETVFHWMMDDKKLYLERKLAATSAGYPQAAENAARVIWESANKKPTERTVTHLVERTKLSRTLRRFRKSLLEEITKGKIS